MIRREVLRPDFECGRGNLLDVRGAEADQPVGSTLVDDEVKVLDRPRPVSAGFQDIANPPLLEPSDVRLTGSRNLVDPFQEIIGNTIVGDIPLDLQLHRLVLAQSLPQDGVEAEAEAGAIAVLDGNRLTGWKSLLANHRRLHRPRCIVKRVAPFVRSRRY